MDISGEDNKIFHIQFHSESLLRFNSTEWRGNGMFQKVIIHSQKVFTGNSREGGGGCWQLSVFHDRLSEEICQSFQNCSKHACNTKLMRP